MIIANTVVVEEIERILTDELFLYRNRVDGSNLSKQFLVRHFAAAKAFVALVYAHS